MEHRNHPRYRLSARYILEGEEVINKSWKWILLCVTPLILISSKNHRKESDKMKIVQTKILAEEGSMKLNQCINEWLIQNKIVRDDLISCEFDCAGGYRRVLIVYEVEYRKE